MSRPRPLLLSVIANAALIASAAAFTPKLHLAKHYTTTVRSFELHGKSKNNNHGDTDVSKPWHQSVLPALGLACVIALSPLHSFATTNAALESVSTVTQTTTTSATTTQQQYDGFADYAKDNQMEQSDVGCFINKCGAQTKALFSNPRGIKGVSCLGRCKGEQSCATRCFAEFGSESLNDWLSCTIQDNECVKVPKSSIDNSAEMVGYATAVKKFDPTQLIGTWYKTDGLNPNYDLFDCQTNTFTQSTNSKNELDMGIFFRVRRPPEAGGGFWENSLVEHMIVDNMNDSNNNDNNNSPLIASSSKSDNNKQSAASSFVANAATTDSIENNNDNVPAGRTMHTLGKMYGLEFYENWFIIGESDGSNNIPPYKLVAYKGHTLQGNYEGAFVYAKQPTLPDAARESVRQAARNAGLDFDKFTQIDNTCPAGNSLNNAAAGTGTSTTDWINLVIGEGGIIDWISPGWRGEYKKA